MNLNVTTANQQIHMLYSEIVLYTVTISQVTSELRVDLTPALGFVELGNLTSINPS